MAHSVKRLVGLPLAPKGYILKADAAKICGCTKRTVDNLMRRKLIPFYKFGRRVYFKEADLLKAIEATIVTAGNSLPPTANDSQIDPYKAWTATCQWLRLIENGRDEKHARLAKDCLAYIGKFIP
jgi:excisionase family DNA binding protein